MQSASANAEALWLQMERLLIQRDIVPMNDQCLQLLLDDARIEKERIETEQIIARVMYKPCFNDETPGKISVRNKFRYLARYYYRMQNYAMFGMVVLSSVIREWPVSISSADEKKPYSKIWDRAPISIAMKDGSIRKKGDEYVIRVLALDGEHIGPILTRADVNTQLMIVDENNQEGPTTAYIIELNKEGGGDKKREAPASGGGTAKRGRGTARAKNRDEAQSPSSSSYFENGFDHLPGNDGLLVFIGSAGKGKDDYVSKESNNVIFSISNISIIDPVNRTAVTQKYILKTHFEFHFLMSGGGSFVVKSNDYQCPVRSMTFEASSNPSTHWKKSFSAIWDTLFIYHSMRGELFDNEIGGSKEECKNTLRWGRVKEMVRHFIGFRSEFYVRELMENELRTVSRMILAGRLSKINEEYAERCKEKSNVWVIDRLPPKHQEPIQLQLLGKVIPLRHDRTFTQHLNEHMQSRPLPDDFLVTQSDFTDQMIVLSSGLPEIASCSIHSWLHAASEIITGPMLHFSNPQKTTIRMFNDNLITLRSSESARRTVTQILAKVEDGREGLRSNAIFIRIDEREEFRLLFEMINLNTPADPYHFGSYNAKAIKETKVAIKKENLSRSEIEAAIKDGVISKTKFELCGLFAVLKTGYLAGFHKIITNQHGKTILTPIFKGGDKLCPVYPYDFTPAPMVNNEINPLIGPMQDKGATDDKEEVFSLDETVIASMKSMRIAHVAQQAQQMMQPAPQPSPYEYPNFASPYAPSAFHQPQPQFAYPAPPHMRPVQQMHPIVNNVQYVQHVHQYNGSDPPPYSSPAHDQVTYATQGVQAQSPFTPPDPVTLSPMPANSMRGIPNPNYTQM